MTYVTNLCAYAVGVDAIVSIPANAVDYAVDDPNPEIAARLARLVNGGKIKMHSNASRYFVAGEALSGPAVVTLKAPTTATTKVARTNNVATLTMAANPFVVGDVVTVSGISTTAASTNIARADNVATITMASNPFKVGDIITVTGFLTTAAGLNGTDIEVLTANATTITYANTGDAIESAANTNGVLTATSSALLSFNAASVTVLSSTATTITYANTAANVTEVAHTDGSIVAVSNPIRAFYANATDNTKPAEGYIKSGSVAKGAQATIYFDGVNDTYTGLTPGQMYFLSATNGAVTATAPSGTGKIVQVVGSALSATELDFNVNTYVVLA